MANVDGTGHKRAGHVYVLTSPNSECVKIGGTDHPPLKRIREINGCSPYRECGPWRLADFRQVADWRRVETHLHYAFRSALDTETAGQRELFRLAPHTVSRALEALDPADIIGRPKVDRMFNDGAFAGYIERLFAFAGLMHRLDGQGGWVFVLFPSTAGGRYFTLNIGRHEVAFTTLPRQETGLPVHMILVDRLIYDFPDTIGWVRSRGGRVRDDIYASGRGRAVSLFFDATMQDATAFLRLDGVRRAMIAYWHEGLIELAERGSLSLFSKHHDWNAVAELRRRLEQRAVSGQISG